MWEHGRVFTQSLGDNDGVVREAFLGNIVPLAKTEKKCLAKRRQDKRENSMNQDKERGLVAVLRT